jgi:hypothetical protein
MANKPPVHVEPREDGWAVVREGAERATSVHPTQSEAATEGRELARQNTTEFFLHAQDGRIREHRSYEEEPSSTPSEDKGIVDQAAQTAGAVTGGVVDAAARAVGTAGAVVPTAGNHTGKETERTGDTTGVDADEGTSAEEDNEAEEVRSLT